MPYALLLFVAMPIIEIAVLLRVGSALGWLPTLAIVVLTAILGTALLRQQGMATLNTARQRLHAGEMPAQQMLEGVVLLVGGVLLLTPGFVTDAFGFICLFPVTRHWLAGRIAARSSVGFVGMGSGMGAGGSTQGPPMGTPVGSGSTPGARNSSETGYGFGADAGGKPQPDSSSKAPAGDVIDAEFRPVDD